MKTCNTGIKRYKDEVKLSNYYTLKAYNDEVVAQVNDSIKAVLNVLMNYADHIDTMSFVDGEFVLVNRKIFCWKTVPNDTHEFG